MQAPTGKHRNRPTTQHQSSDEGEAFNLNVSDTSSVGEPVVTRTGAPARAKRTQAASGRATRAATRAAPTAPPSATPAAPPSNTGSSTAHDASEQAAAVALLQPFVLKTGTGSGRSNKAHDTKYFFPHGEVLEKGDKVMKQICRVCQTNQVQNPTAHIQTYSLSTTSGTLRAHLAKYHREKYDDKCSESGWTNQLAATEKQKAEKAEVAIRISEREPFSTQGLLKRIVRVVECPEFREILLYACREIDDSDIVKRDKIRSVIIDTSADYYQVLKKQLSAALGKVSYTSDMWSKSDMQSFYAMTAHWLYKDKNKNIKLAARLIAFHRFEGRHTAKNMADVTLRLLDRAGTTANSGHFTLDNLETNTAMMRELETLFAEREIPFSAKHNHIMCFPHVINIVVQHVITKFSSSVAGLDYGFSQGPRGRSLPPETFEEACARDPLRRAHMIITAIRSSGQRRDQWINWIKTGNENGWFKSRITEQTVILPLKQLMLDVKTRWDSTYKMLTAFIEMSPVVDTFLKSPQCKDLEHLSLSEKEWEVLGDFAHILVYPHQVQTMLSKEGTPVLAGAISSLEIFITKWETLAKVKPWLKTWIDEGLTWANKYYKRLDLTNAYVIALFINPSVRFTWIEDNWGKDSEYKKRATTEIKALMTKYHWNEGNDQNNATITPAVATAAPREAFLQYLDEYESRVADASGNNSSTEQTIDEEYNNYVAGAPKHPAALDPIKFWETNRAMFPTLFKIALDYLPIQASSVPCERVFSSSAETDTKKRNRIKHDLMEALQVLKFAYKKDRLNFTSGLLTSEEEMIGDSEIVGSDLSEDSSQAADKVVFDFDCDL